MSSSDKAVSLTVSQCRIPQFAIAAAAVPWVPLGAGKAIKPLRFLRDDRGYVGLLRLDAGVDMPLHRHSGDVHAFNLEGWRELDTGERFGPGGYVYEPPGNVDRWRTVGEEPIVVLVVVNGAVEYLDRSGAVTDSRSAGDVRASYLQHCAQHAITAEDLGE